MMASKISPAAETGYDQLRREWPHDPAIDWEEVKLLFFALSPEDQDHCSRLAVRYLSACRRTGTQVASPTRWIEARGWKAFLEAERRTTRHLQAKATPVWVVEGTSAWAAWRRHRESKSQRMPSPECIRAERGSGWWFPDTFPPNPKAKPVNQRKKT